MPTPTSPPAPAAGSGRRRTFGVAGRDDPAAAQLVDDVAAALVRAGFVRSDNETAPSLVLNVVDAAAPRSFRRRSKGTFVAAIWSTPDVPADGLHETYPMLVRALANISLCYVPGYGVLFTTMERGHYLVPEG